MNSEQVTQYCYVCRADRSHTVTYLVNNDLATIECGSCGRQYTHGQYIHWLYQGEGTVCGLDIGGVRGGLYIDRRFAKAAPEVTCPDCALLMVEYLAPPSVPDWRPDQAIAEDFYAA